MTHYPAALERHLQGSPNKGQDDGAETLVHGEPLLHDFYSLYRCRCHASRPISCMWPCLTHGRNCAAAGLKKGTFKKWVRRAGTVCAVLQLGTAFAATRALFSSEARQRLVEMDLR